MEGKRNAVYNPLEKSIEELPVIYGFNNGGNPTFLAAVLIAEDGVCLGSHICSHENYMPHDLGILEGTRPDRHERFRKHYPDGYRMEFIPSEELEGHEKFNKAIELNQAAAAAAKEGDGDAT